MDDLNDRSVVLCEEVLAKSAEDLLSVFSDARLDRIVRLGNSDDLAGNRIDPCSVGLFDPDLSFSSISSLSCVCEELDILADVLLDLDQLLALVLVDVETGVDQLDSVVLKVVVDLFLDALFNLGNCPINHVEVLYSLACDVELSGDNCV